MGLFKKDEAVKESSILEALRIVNDPDLNRDIVSLGFVKDLRINDGKVSFTIELTTPACPVKDQLKAEAQSAVAKVPGVTGVEVSRRFKWTSKISPQPKTLIPRVSNTPAVPGRNAARANSIPAPTLE